MYFSTRLLAGFPENGTFTLEVAPGEADATQVIVKSMFTGKLPAADASAAELVVMYKVADRLQAKCTGVIVDALLALPAEEWDWDTASMVRALAEDETKIWLFFQVLNLCIRWHIS
jgi:hypothetical protein